MQQCWHFAEPWLCGVRLHTGTPTLTFSFFVTPSICFQFTVWPAQTWMNPSMIKVMKMKLRKVDLFLTSSVFKCSEHQGYIKYTRVTHLGMSVCTNPDFLQASCVNLNRIKYKNYKKTLLIIIFTSRYGVAVNVTVLACIRVVVRGVVLSLSLSL